MTALHLAGRQFSQGPSAEQVIDGDTWSPELNLEPVARAILTDLASAVRGHAHDLVLLSRLNVAHPDHARILDRLIADGNVRQAFRLPLNPDEAMRLSTELYEACDEPALCERCGSEDGNYRMPGDALCTQCQGAGSPFPRSIA